MDAKRIRYTQEDVKELFSVYTEVKVRKMSGWESVSFKGKIVSAQFILDEFAWVIAKKKPDIPEGV